MLQKISLKVLQKDGDEIIYCDACCKEITKWGTSVLDHITRTGHLDSVSKKRQGRNLDRARRAKKIMEQKNMEQRTLPLEILQDHLELVSICLRSGSSLRRIDDMRDFLFAAHNCRMPTSSHLKLLIPVIVQIWNSKTSSQIFLKIRKLL